MPLIEAWIKAWLYLGFMIGWSRTARPQFDISTDMGLVLVPADAEVDSAIFRLRATDQDADFPLLFDISGLLLEKCKYNAEILGNDKVYIQASMSATATPVVRVENLPCTLYNKVCQANVILVRRLIPGRLHDFVVRVKDSKGDYNLMQATISVTNSTTPRDKIFPHIPSLIMVPEDAKPGSELDYIEVRSNPWSGKPVYIELWQPKELFKIRQRQTTAQTRGIITLTGELDFETQSMYTLTIYATDPYTERGKDTRNIAGLQVVVVVQDVQDVPPIFTMAPPLTKINNTVQPGDVILRVHAEDGDKGVPREVTYGLLPENNPFVSFFNISETIGEIMLVRPLQELTQITYVGAPVVLKVVAEEIRKTKEEPPAQSTVVEVGFLLGEPGNNPPHFENDNYMAWLDENAEPGTMVMFSDPYSTKVKDEDVGKAGVFALKLENNNGTFEVSPAVSERSVNFVITVRDNSLIDYEMHQSLHFKITAQEVGPATNLSTTVPVTIFLRDINDNQPTFDVEFYEVELSENATIGTKVVQVHATDKDSGLYGMIQYTRITGPGSEAFTMDPNTGVISVAMGSKLDRELTSQLQLLVEARDELGRGLRGVVPLIVNLLDVNDNAPIFDKPSYEFTLNAELTNFTIPAFLKASDADAEPPNNVVRYEIIHGNYDNKFYLNEVTGELVLREAVNKTRYIRQNTHPKDGKQISNGNKTENSSQVVETLETTTVSYKNNQTLQLKNGDVRTKRAEELALFTLTARAYDLGVPHLSTLTRIRVLRGAVMGARIVLFVMPGEHPDPAKTADTLATITGGRVIIQEIRPYVPQPSDSEGGKKSVIVARVEQKGSGTLVDIEKIREILAANGVGVISGMDPTDGISTGEVTGDTKIVTNSSVTIHNEEVTVYKAENKLLMWLLILLGLLILLAIICLIICCICPGCPFYMEPRKRRIHSSETLIYRTDGRPKKHLHRKRTNLEAVVTDSAKKQAWSADPMKRNWQFNRRNTKQYGIASLPGDVVRETAVDIEPKRNALSLRLPESPDAVHKSRDFIRRSDDDRIYIEDVEGQARNYDAADIDSIRRHEIARGSDISRQRQMAQQLANQNAKVREQHFFREGNAEVLRLVTRGQDEERNRERDQLQEREQMHRPVALVIEPQSHLFRDGKDILLQRFIEDQEIRQDLLGSRHDIEGVSMESHQHPKEMSPRRQEILLIPQRLDSDQRYHYEHLGPGGQSLLIDRGDYTETRRVDVHENARRESQGLREGGGEAMASDPTSKSVENSTDDARDPVQSNVQAYTINEVELVRQNALLTRLLLEREASKGVGGTMDTGSYLETQSLPGQVATATQTDRTTATQTDRQVRSRSDNDESEDDDRLRKKTKVKKKSELQPKLMKTIWIKSAIPEEVHRRDVDDRSSSFRKRISESKDTKRASVSPEVLQEISDSLDEIGNSSSPRDEGEEDDSFRIQQRIIGKEKSKRYESKPENSTSPETEKDRFVKGRVKKAKEKAGFIVSSARKKGEPSFRILEKEISSLQKRIRTFGQRKSWNVDEEVEEEEGDDSKKVEKKVRDVREQKKSELKQDIELKLDTELKHSLSKEADLTRKKKLDESRLKNKPLKHQHAIETISSEILEQENDPEKRKKYGLKTSEDKPSTKKPLGHFKLKRQSRLQVSKGAVKSIISRTKEVTKRKVRELKKDDESSGEKQPIRKQKHSEDFKRSFKSEADAVKIAYTIVSSRIKSPPSKAITESDKAKQQKTVDVMKSKAQLAKSSVVTNGESKTLISQQSIAREKSKDLIGQDAVRADRKEKLLLDQKSAEMDGGKKQFLEQQSPTENDRKEISSKQKSAKTDEREEGSSEQQFSVTNGIRKQFLDQKSSTADGRRQTLLDQHSVTMDVRSKDSSEKQSVISDGSSKPSSKQQSIVIDSERKSLEQKILATYEEKKQSVTGDEVKKPSVTEVKDKIPSVTEFKDKISSVTEVKDKIPSVIEIKDKIPSVIEIKDKIPSVTEVKDKIPSLEQEIIAITADEEPDLGKKPAATNGSDKPLKQESSTTERSKTPLMKQDLEAEESSPKIKKPMLETDDMKFIDDSQESTEDTSDETHSTIKHLSDVPQREKTDTDLRTESSYLQSEKDDEKVSGKVKEEIKEPHKSERIMSKESESNRKNIEAGGEAESPESSSDSVQSKNDEEILKQGKEFPYRLLPESETSADSITSHEDAERKESLESKTLKDSVRDERIEFNSGKDEKKIEEKEMKDDVKVQKEDDKDKDLQEERKGDVKEEQKGDVQEETKDIKHMKEKADKEDVQDKSKTAKSPHCEHVSSPAKSIDPSLSVVGIHQITSPSKISEETDRFESSDQTRKIGENLDEIPKSVDRVPISKPLSPKIEGKSLKPELSESLTSKIETKSLEPELSESLTPKIEAKSVEAELSESLTPKIEAKSLEPELSESLTPKIEAKSLEPELSESLSPKAESKSLAPELTEKAVSKSANSKDKITEDLAIQKPSSPIKISSREADHERKIAKVLAEEQQRLQRLELLYKHYSEFNESEDDSDSSTDSDMSSKTMFTTQPYNTPRHSPVRKINNEDNFKIIEDDKDRHTIVASDDSNQLKKATPKKSPLRIPRQSAVDVEDENKIDIKEHTDDHKTRPVVVDVVKKQNLKDISTPQKPAGRINNSLRSSKALLDPKSSSDIEAKKTHVSNDETRKSKFVRDKSPLVADGLNSAQDVKMHPEVLKKEDVKHVEDSRKQLTRMEITKSHLSEDNAKKQLKRRDKSPLALVAEKLKETTSKELDAKGSDTKRVVSKKDTRKPILDKSASTTDVEKQLKKMEDKRERKRSLSPRKDVRKYLSDEEKKVRDKSPMPSQKSPKREIRKSKDPVVSKKEPQSKTEVLHKDDHPRKSHITKSKIDKDIKSDSGKEEVITAQSRYMSWYKQKREEMEKKRLERKLAEEEDQRPRWMKRKITKPKEPTDKSSELKPDGTPKTRHKVKPSVNIESEQLKAIVRQGRKMRKAKGSKEDLTVQIFAPKKPAPMQDSSMQPTPKHPLIQHSEYKYEKVPPPFYLHPPPAPHPSPQLSPEHFPDQEGRKADDDLDSGIAVSLQGGTKLRHQQLLEKKSVFDIAYNEAAPSHLRSDSSTPPS